jgi:hypothetical protein
MQKNVTFRDGGGGCVGGGLGTWARQIIGSPAPIPGALVGEGYAAQEEQQGEGVQDFAFHDYCFIRLLTAIGCRMLYTGNVQFEI